MSDSTVGDGGGQGLHAHVGVCRLCGNEDGMSALYARDMMFGMPGEHLYMWCPACTSLQYAGSPLDGDEMYPSHYYAYATARGWRESLTRRLEVARVRTVFGRGGMLGGWVTRRYPNTAVQSLKLLDLQPSDAILDVGCGSGRLIHAMYGAGFRNVTGADPYFPDGTMTPAQGPRFIAAPISQVDGSFNVVMFHHSFEHLADPRAALDDAARLLVPGGRCLIATPNPDSHAFRSYGAAWVQLDAPRHLFLFSPKTFERVLDDLPFTIERVVWDSTAFQFWASEMYQTGATMHDPKTGARREPPLPIMKRMQEFDRMATELNAGAQGDQYVILLRRRM